MSAKTERPQVRTAQDLERKYNISGISEAVKMSEEGLVKVNNELAEFISTTADSLENIQNQVDGQIVTFYGNTAPTLENYPVSGWTEDEYDNHIGDMYYDNNSGKSYRFEYKNDAYIWVQTNNEDINRILGIANAAKDTADSKRRIFTATPTPPYDSGDIWINNVGATNGEIYICQTGRDATQTYTPGDFIIATKYTDDTVATATKNSLEVLSGKVTYEVSNNYSKTEIEKIIEGTGFRYDKTIDTTFIASTAANPKEYSYYIPLYSEGSSEPNENGNTYVVLVEGTDYQVGDSISSWSEAHNNYEVFEKTEIKVTKVETASAVYDENGMHYKKDGTPTESTINQYGLEVDELDTPTNPYIYAGYVAAGDDRFDKKYTSGGITTTLIKFQDSPVVYTKNLVTEGQTVIGTRTIFLDYKDTYNGNDVEGTGWFVI